MLFADGYAAGVAGVGFVLERQDDFLDEIAVFVHNEYYGIFASVEIAGEEGGGGEFVVSNALRNELLFQSRNGAVKIGIIIKIVVYDKKGGYNVGKTKRKI